MIRPLASGAINQSQALGFLAIQLTGGLAVLTQLNLYSVVIIYPLMKRITYWPQAVLGLAFNWGALLGWPAMLGSSDWTVTLPLYAAGVTWTLMYDTIYAHQDKVDDVGAGVKSTALLLGENSRMVLSGFGAATIAFLCLSGYMGNHGWPYFVGVLFGGGSQLSWQLAKVDFNNTQSCWRMFKSNTWFGFIIFLAIVADKMYKEHLSEDEADGDDKKLSGN
ncbi:Para-hydroxybenzoate--polyprenyltransferase, mitochondrial precursor (PHB:polyprenyltransferase) [Mycoemilia scoparia]|uniref:Para-hydroxybenzoate--polyprenyltransferase, mitochondrial (PHB:polyprenyltransferase) n=1 Tax=Mycoemilia scoparia TaxID=417184 RepID=A0A9W7ZYZ4_9FUNG|nr:Para-hydroxybenzoate--polyprenyltransferase, mitochondrial precursor (PHB:polyprenyltransferase) [Mycoemilia scoparia]